MSSSPKNRLMSGMWKTRKRVRHVGTVTVSWNRTPPQVGRTVGRGRFGGKWPSRTRQIDHGTELAFDLDPAVSLKAVQALDWTRLVDGSNPGLRT